MKIQTPNKERRKAEVILVNKNQLITEPVYNGGQRKVGATSQPFLLFHKNNLAVIAEDDVSKPEIVKAYYTNNDGQRLESISKNVAIILVIETRNMIGEELVINLTNALVFEYKKQLVSETQALKLKIKREVEFIPLSVIPAKPPYEPPKRIGKYEEVLLKTYFENEDGDLIQNSGWGNRVYMIVETRNMIGKKVSIVFDEEGKFFNHPQLQDNQLNITIEKDIQKIAFDLE